MAAQPHLHDRTLALERRRRHGGGRAAGEARPRTAAGTGSARPRAHGRRLLGQVPGDGRGPGPFLGEVLPALRRSGQDRDTVAVFSSDNGGERYSDSWPLSGSRYALQEGGIRVPTILRWPARIGGHQVSHVPVFTPDWTATFLDTAGARPDPATPLDGVSLTGHLLRGEEAPGNRSNDLFRQ
ncbi:sulfatase-like hydrolase/transferase [Streptomyces sp. NPDC051658]|uniref:sulfatase-like hydrolase/transferase n=1 Tax=Streptomyces sp. NPDC051658 TaxID=3365667 RepID=UPI0037A2C224